MLVILGLIHAVNGIWMLAAPMSWYGAVPGVAQTGPLNHHFIADIGLAFMASGAGMMLGSRKGFASFGFAGAGWPVLHAVLHAWGWVHEGFPGQLAVALSEAIGVVAVGALGAWAAWWNARREGNLQ
jgi:hypothetical protein